MTPIPAWVVFRSQAGAPFWIEPVPLPLPVPEWISVLAMFNSSVESGRRDEASGIGYFLPRSPGTPMPLKEITFSAST